MLRYEHSGQKRVPAPVGGDAPCVWLVVQADSSEGHRAEHAKVPDQLPILPLSLLARR